MPWISVLDFYMDFICPACGQTEAALLALDLSYYIMVMRAMIFKISHSSISFCKISVERHCRHLVSKHVVWEDSGICALLSKSYALYKVHATILRLFLASQKVLHPFIMDISLTLLPPLLPSWRPEKNRYYLIQLRDGTRCLSEDSHCIKCSQR